MQWLSRRLGGLTQDWSHDPSAMPNSRKYLICLVMAFGQFMALFDIQIVSASLSDVQAGLAAGPDEVSWVQTAYLMAELVMIPLSAYLARAMSSRWLFVFSCGAFTFFSLMCGLSWNIESMIVFRALQGFTGGAMVPLVFAVGFTIFTGKQRSVSAAILGMVTVLAPTLGPTAGGLITDKLDWRWLFFINVLPGIVVAILSMLIVRVDKGNLSMIRKIDWSHFIAMAVFLGGLEYVLEEGPKKDWLGDPTVAIVAWLSFVAFILFLQRAFRSDNPLVSLRPLRKPMFAFACLFSLVTGFGMYSSIYLVPLYLARVRGYDSLQIGTTVVVVGAAQLVSTIIAASLIQRVDLRWMISAGLLLFAASLWQTSYFTPQWGFWELALPQALRGLAMMLCVVPCVNMALTPFTAAELPAASGLFNVMRNLGGAIGIAVVNTWLQDNSRIAASRIGEAMGHRQQGAQDMVTALATRFSTQFPDPVVATTLAKAQLARLIGQHAVTLAFNDAFRLMCWMFLGALMLVPLCKPVRAGHSPDAAAAH
ncbi:DHA2 family efflux MFS transporter permease subunit [Sphingobium chlorophenolicum]|uniref:Drug resistance transporter, EmrB/QacA subfamily n=1 Tax=Sphingobium chlorophenolicum TaxID=46429 RepID=A0A081REC1_SPHCR|nr:DHA2 family efflux MFS transporter permease subunit [Sphingobium chlorophenolicum]KEQ53544.1 Drug resistance transporter, EmrB/QacA subfamily [Sphingobium chlorophenolicum]